MTIVPALAQTLSAVASEADASGGLMTGIILGCIFGDCRSYCGGIGCQ